MGSKLHRWGQWSFHLDWDFHTWGVLPDLAFTVWSRQDWSIHVSWLCLWTSVYHRVPKRVQMSGL